jgi:hypothetical protein
MSQAREAGDSERRMNTTVLIYHVWAVAHFAGSMSYDILYLGLRSKTRSTPGSMLAPASQVACVRFAIGVKEFNE